MGSTTGELEAACQRVAADGTDAAWLAELTGWSVRPRRGLDAVRRLARDAGTETVPPALRSSLRAQVDDQDRSAAMVVVERWAALGCRVAVVGDPAYPVRLGEGWPHVAAPVWWVWRGEHALERPHVAIVGARHASAYGRSVAAWVAEAVGDAGGRVVSGGAVGIDAAAHRASLATVGGTTVVLGCGHAVPYPRAHARPEGLFHEVVDQGGALACELMPDEPPRPAAVRARNRIVAGLSDAVVVVEGSVRSGALLTAGAAAERGRPVLAVPGDVRAPGSAAPHLLLAEGAHPCSAPSDVLEVIGVQAVGASEGSGAGGVAELPPQVYRALVERWPRPIPLEDLSELTGVGVAGLLGAVTRGEVAGLLASDVAGVRLRERPRAHPLAT